MKKPTYFAASNPFLPEDGGGEDLCILFAGHSQTKPGHQNGPRVFDYYLIHVVLSGRGTFECEGHKWPMAAGDSFVIEPGRLVAYRADDCDPWFYRWIAVKGKRAAELFSRCGIDWRHPVVRGGGEDGALGPAAPGTGTGPGESGAGAKPAGRPSPARWIERTERVFRERTPGGDLAAEGFFSLLLADFAARLAPGPAEPRGLTRVELHMRQAAQRLTAQFAEPVRVDELAEQFGYSRSYFSRMFKKVNGATPAAFLTSLRTGKARQMLRERPDLSVEQIAHSVGYGDALYFSKQFKKVHGLSPSEYRKTVISAGENRQPGRNRGERHGKTDS